MNNTLLLTVGIIGFVFLILNAVFLGIIFFMRRKMAVVSEWPSTMGTVNASYLERRFSSEGDSTNYPVVKYSYQIGGQRYQSTKLAPGPEVGGTGAGKVVERYPAGAQVMVCYERDGAPLSAQDGPLAILAPGDTRTGPRHVKWLQRIEVRVLRD